MFTITNHEWYQKHVPNLLWNSSAPSTNTSPQKCELGYINYLSVFMIKVGTF